MRMPRGSKLDRLIRFPVEWNQFFLRIEREGRMMELLKALEELPESSVRDVRISRIWVRQGRLQEAKDLVYRHRRCPLARSQYFAFVLKNADEDTIRHLVDNYRPSTSLGQSLLNVEAQYQDAMTLAIAAQRIKRTKMAQDMYFQALQTAKFLKDTHSENIVIYQMALMRMWDNQFNEARSTFEQLMKKTSPNMVIYQYALEYITWICWINNDRRDYLPDWAVESLNALQQQQPLSREIQFPSEAGLPWLLSIMQNLRKLTREFNLHLPVLYVKANKRIRDELVEKIRADVGEDVGEMHGFTSRAMLALALSMQHDSGAVDVLRSAFKWPTTGVAAMTMLYYACLIQIHANLPQVQMDSGEIRQALQLLSTQFRHLPDGQQQWLLRWMKDFTPITLYLLSEKFWKAHPPLHDFVVVQPEGVYRGTESVEKYPRFFMVRTVTDLLEGKTPPANNRMQAWRHVKALEPLGSPLVIYQPVLRRFETFLH